MYPSIFEFEKKIEMGGSNIYHMELINQSPLKRVRSVMKIANKQIETITFPTNNKALKRRKSLLTCFGIKKDID